MSAIFELHAAKRNVQGKGASRRLRRKANLVPAIVYGIGKESTMITLDHNKVLQATQNEAFFSHILTLNIDNKPEQVVIKDIQRHPYKPIVLHMDFLRINPNEKIHMHIPLHFMNEATAIGVKIGGGVIAHLASEIEIKCLPKNLPEYVEIDLENMNLGEMWHLSDIKLPEGVEFVHNLSDPANNIAIVSIHVPRAVVEEVEEGAPVAIETEITSEKKPTEEEGKEGKESKKE